MRLFVLGANGRTGTELVDLALARAHEVTAFVRSPEKMARDGARLTIVRGDPHDAEAMARAMGGHDAVFSALGPRPAEAFRGTTLLRDCAASAVRAMRGAGVGRILFVSSAALFPGLPLAMRLVASLLRRHIEDLRRSEAILNVSPLEWTVARPPRLVRASEEAYRELEDALPPRAFQMSFRAVARFMLESAERALHSRKVVGLAGPSPRKRDPAAYLADPHQLTRP